MDEIITAQSTKLKDLILKLDIACNLIDELVDDNKRWICKERYLAGDEFCKQFHISRRTLQDYRDTRIIPYTSIGGKILYPESEIEKILQENYQSANDLDKGSYTLLNTNYQKL